MPSRYAKDTELSFPLVINVALIAGLFAVFHLAFTALPENSWYAAFGLTGVMSASFLVLHVAGVRIVSGPWPVYFASGLVGLQGVVLIVGGIATFPSIAVAWFSLAFLGIFSGYKEQR